MKKQAFRKMLPLFLAVFLSWQIGSAQIVINEICPTNTNIITNSNGEYDDWMELHNSGTTSVNLAGYGLTDDAEKPFQFTFPNYTLSAGQKVIVFASDHSTQQIADHWEMAVNAGTTWKYAAGSASLDSNWRNISFNEAAWTDGHGGIGFGDGDDNAIIPIGASVMMRKTFTVTDTSKVVKGVLLMDYDDGFVAYLNGVEIARANLGTPGFRPAWNDIATNSHEAKSYRGQAIDSFYISPTLMKSAIRPGTNVLSIEVHNTPVTSDDLSSIPYLFFGMRTTGLTYMPIPSWFHVPAKEYFNAKFKINRYGETLYLYNPAGTVVDQATSPSVEINHSYSRTPDGSANWCFISTPTPGTTNNGSTCYSSYATSPVFSKAGGYYSTAQTLTLSSSTPGGVIRYTTNGNTPTENSTQYTSAISLATTKTIRAKVFAPGYLPSPMVTNTYIIGKTTKLSTFTITTDSSNLWDYNNGIYVLGPNAATTSPYKGANYWQDWEKPASIEYYDKNKNLVMKFDADIRIYGNYSRAKPQKSFEIKLRDSYGVGSFDYPMYSDKPYVDKVDNIILRNAGTDWNKVHFRDGMMERLLKNTYTGYLADQPAIAYLNGEYWGVYHINENHDQHWMKNNFGYDRKEIDYLRESGTTMNVQEGSDESFWTLYNYATTQSPATQQYYDYVNTLLDLKNYADYFVAETFYNNGDWIGEWTNNIKLWRPDKNGAKWRYLVYDLDYGMGLKGDVNDNRLGMARNPLAFSHSSEMFDAILKNPTFKRYFINRYADLMNTTFLPSNVNTVMKTFKDTMSADMPNHFAKWGSSTTTWNTEISDMLAFSNARPDIMKNYINSEFGLAGTVTLTFNVQPNGSGRIEISTVTPTSYPWTGDYFNGNPVTITAIPNPGYTFDHWRSNKVITSNNVNQSVTYNFNKDDAIKAYFTGSSVTPKICVSELNYNADSVFNSGDWIELHNYGTTALDISGWKLTDGNDNHFYKFPTGTKIAANGYLVVVEDSTKFKKIYPGVTNWIGLTGFNFSNAGDQIRLFNHLNALYLSFFYQQFSPWPVLADGDGYTCELTSNTANPNVGASWFAGCLGGSPGRAYSTTMMVPLSVSGSTTFCAGSSTVLRSSTFLGNTYQWKKAGVNISGATDSVYSATTAGVYTVTVSNHGCSEPSPATTVSTVTQQPMPATVSASRCGPGELTLSATSTDSVYWYDAATGGNLVFTGNTFAIPYLQQTKTYYARTGKNCASNPVATLAEIMPPAASPVAVDASRCGPGIVTLTATDTAAMRWYNAPSGGGLLASGNSFTSNNLDHDTSYFVEAGSVCPSSRIEVRVTINMSATPVVNDASRCGNGAVTFTATSADPVYWYDSPSGGAVLGTGNSFTTGNLAEADTFYVEANGGCASARVRAIALINEIPEEPIIPDAAICSPGVVTLTADATEQVNWYSSATGNTILYTGTVFTTPALSASTTYYASNGYTCQSSRVAAHAIISSQAAPPVAPNVTRCDSGTVILTATSPELIYWYASASDSIPLATASSYETPGITSTATYYVEAGTYCRSSRIPVQAIVNSTPAAPASSDVARCGNGSVTMNATAPQQMFWYNVPTGGNALATGASFTTNVNSSTVFYVEDGGTCRSSRTPVNVTVNALPAAPVTASVTRCGAGSVTLTATSNTTVNWYSSSTGGAPIATGLSFTTPLLNTTTTYYAEAFDGCSSGRVAVQAIISAIPTNPTVTNASRCGQGSLVLNATSPSQLNWFTASTGGTAVGTGASFTTPAINSTTVYYVEAGTTCKSARVAVTATVNPVPSDPTLTGASRCGNGALNLTASSASTVNWFNTSTGGSSIFTGMNFTTPSLSSTTTYYAESNNGTCSSQRIPVQATVIPILPAPVVTGAARCDAGSVTLFANSTGTVSWFTNATGGSAIATGTSFVTPVLTTSTVYYAEASNGCTSARVPVQASVSGIPSVPVANDVIGCGQGSVQLNASSPVQITWYDAAGTQIGTGSVYNTPALTSTTTYYAEAGSAGCTSARTAIRAIIHAIPSAPSVSGNSICGPGQVMLSATGNGNLDWFDSPSNGNAIGSGNTFTTPVLSASNNYYVEVSDDTCSSARVQVQAIVNPVPAPPVATDVTSCTSGTFTLNATSSEQIFWYDASTGGNLLATGSSFTTPVITATATYFVEAGNLCRSTRIPVQAIIVPVSVSPIVSGNTICGAGSVALQASSPDQLFWYDSPNAVSPVGTGSVFMTPFITASTTYYVEAGTTCKSSRVPVNATIANTEISSVYNGYHCGAGNIVLTAISSVTSDSIVWYDQPGGNVIGTGGIFMTPYLSSNETYYVTANSACVNSPVAVNAVINPLPVVNLGNDLLIAGGQTITLFAGQGYASYVWSTGSVNPSIQVNSQGAYSVTVTDNNGCSASDEILVSVLTGINTVNSDVAVRVFPNPAKDNITVDISGIPSKTVVMRILSVDGKQISREEVNTFNSTAYKTLSLQGVAAGVYVLNVESDKFSKTFRIVIE